MDTTLKDQLFKICKEHYITEKELKDYKGELVNYDHYPYAPYIPKNWNKILVLGGSQKIKAANNGKKEYRESLMDLSENEMIFRLGNPVVTYKKPDQFIGVEPWDNGYLKIAMISCFPESRLDEYGISNAIPWEMSKDNKNWNILLNNKSTKFWKVLFSILKPKYVITVGNDALYTILVCYPRKEMKFKFFNLMAPLAPIGSRGIFNESDLYFRYPEVRYAIETNPKIIKRSDPNWRRYVFFAAHAVSKIKSQLYLP